MFRDAREELQRLEQLLEETEETTVEEAELPAEQADDDLPEEPLVFRNYSNDYGGKIYNSDRTDVDLNSYSEEVRQPQKRGVSWLVALVFLLLTGIVVMLGLFVLKMRGVL